MKLGTSLLAIIICMFLTLGLWSLESHAQSYAPVGPQTNVPEATLTGGGWTRCFIGPYNTNMDADTVLSACPGELLMLACRITDSDTLTLLAQGARSDVTFDTGVNEDVTHIANGVGWYFSEDLGSWGFVRAGDSVDKDECDVDTSGANDERLCWHINGGGGGYRCGVAENLNESTEYERIVYMATPTPVTTSSIPTLSEWGLIATASILGIIGFIAVRRRKATV